jgi:exonuclease III
MGSPDLLEPAAERPQNLYTCHSSTLYTSSFMLRYAQWVSMKLTHGVSILQRHTKHDCRRSHCMRHAARYMPSECVKYRVTVKFCPSANKAGEMLLRDAVQKLKRLLGILANQLIPFNTWSPLF